MAIHDVDKRSTETSVEQEAKDAVDRVKNKTEEIAYKAQDQAKSALAQQKSQAAQQLNDVAQAFRETGQQLRQNQGGGMVGTVAHYTTRLADQVDHFSQQLQEKDIDHLLTDAENLARSQPAIFLGSAFAAGIFLARFLKSSGRRYHPVSESSYPTHRPTTATYGYYAASEDSEVYPTNLEDAEEFRARGERSVTGERTDYGS